MKLRLSYAGGDADGRNVKGKLRSFHSALENSYQAEWITFKDKKCRCLINASQLNEDLDKKFISIDFDSGIKEGSVFYWDRTNQYWLVNLQQHTEEAYFKGDIRRCEFTTEINGTPYWTSLKGPKQEDAEWINKQGVVVNNLNYSMAFQVTKDSKTMNYFTRFKVIKLKNRFLDAETGEWLEEEHRWQVVATDKWSHDGVIDVYVNEYADNAMEDAAVSPEIPEQDPTLPYIDGPRTVEIYQPLVEYVIKNASNGVFVVNSSKVEIVNSDENTCVLNILTGKSGEFEILYIQEEQDPISLIVQIESF